MLKLHKLEVIREKIEPGISYVLTRRVVPGGWLYTTTVSVYQPKGTAVSLASAFVPLAEWKLYEPTQ